MTRGHKARITKKKNDTIEYVSVTHWPYTNKIKNIKLLENPDKKDPKPAYVRPKKFVGTKSDLGKHHSDMSIKNTIDKSIVRHIEKKGRIK